MIDRSLKNVIPERAFRTLEDMDRQITSLQSQLAVLAAKSNGGGHLTPTQIADISGLIGARSQAVIGQDVTDPSLPGQVGGGTVTSLTVGNLSPLFTAAVANATSTPSVTYSQIVQAANLIYAGPASGAAAAPTFRSLVAADLAAILAPMLSSTVLDLNTSTKQTLYTVPAGKSAVVLWVVGRSASTNLSAGVTTNLSFGFNAGANDWGSTTFGTPAFTAASLFLMMDQTDALTGNPSTIGTAAQVLGAITDAAFGAPATLVIEVFGYLF